MMRRFFLPLALLAVLLGACGGATGSDDGSPTPTQAPTTAEESAERFLSLWKAGRYAAMYDLLSAGARAGIDRDKFVSRYEAIAEEATIIGIDYVLLSISEGNPAQAEFNVTIHTSFFGDIEQQNMMTLVREEVTLPASTPDQEPRTRQEWRIEWTPSLIFKELDDRTLVHFFQRVPRRGGIYDRNGNELAVDAQLPVVGIVPDLVRDKETVIARLVEATGLSEAEVRAAVETTLPSYYFIPVKTLEYGTPEAELQKFIDMVELGVVLREETRRVYPHGSSAAHVIGYMREVTAEELEELSLKGFRPGDLIGAEGIEAEYNDVLAGERGGLLATITPEGTIARTIAEKAVVPGRDVHLSIDIAVQKKAEAELGERVGSIVVLDPTDNSVLALATYPRFDPNAFIRGLTAEGFNQLANDPDQPFLHRPLLATYPPGSTFKLVTMAAGLERGGYSPGSRIPCPPVWTGLGEEFKKNNWQTVDRGFLTPAEGLMASCNPVFYEMAKTLDEIDEEILPSFARAFGLGKPTGIGLPEAAGVVPGPQWKEANVGEPWFRGDAVNMGIGQGFLLVTPLQIANMYSAVASSGVLRQPLLVRKIVDPVSGAAQEFEAEVINPLPISQSTLDAIRHGLTLVTQSPGGTSYQVWAGSSVDAAGKSGTAEDLPFGSDHVFFVAYANRSNPSILALAALEEGQSGSREAAPMVRRILESYISGSLVVSP